MANKLAEDGNKLIVYDINEDSINQLIQKYPNNISNGKSISDIAKKCSIVISILPNDKIVADISNELIDNVELDKEIPFIHISCSTISPLTSRHLDSVYKSKGSIYLSSPVFARPDGIASRQATWMLSGSERGKSVATEVLKSIGNVVDFGDDVGSSNVVKLCGNFLIASTIESLGEAMALAEKHNVDRKKVMDLLSSTIFNCLIYKGYGQRISDRDHRAGGFSLELGLKDVTLVSQAARQVDVPMPVLSVLLDRYTSSKAKGRADMDWSAIGLAIAEDAGLDVSEDIIKNKDAIKKGLKY
eukprot:gene19027-24847_t